MMESQSNWRKRTILFFASQCITLFGSQTVQMAIVWYVTLQTNSGAWVAAFSVCSYLPQFFVSFIGGVWADRYNRKYLIIGADALIAAVTLTMMLIMPHIAGESVLLVDHSLRRCWYSKSRSQCSYSAARSRGTSYAL